MLRRSSFIGMRNVSSALPSWVESPAWQQDGYGKSATPGSTRAPGTTSHRRRPRRTCSRRRPSRIPETKRRFRNLLDVTGVLDKLVQLRARPATDEEILRVHTPAHLASVRAVAEAGGDAGDGTAMGRWGDEIAALAAGGSIVAADAVLDGAVDNAYALVRPPGHHAEPGQSMGFCVFSNIGIAIRHAQQVRGVGRVAVVDWDVHHGNGTETIFLSDPERALDLAAPGRALPAGARARRRRGRGSGPRHESQHPAPAGQRHRGLRPRLRARRRAGAARPSGRSSSSSRAASTPARTTRSAAWISTPTTSAR